MSDKFAMQSWPLKRFEFPMPIRYHLTPAKGPGVVVCFHGYQDHALSVQRRLGWWEAELPFQVLAVNGPFPVPLWTGSDFKEAYSWYFRDTSRDLEFVSPEVTATRLKLLLKDLGLEQTPKVLFGFSQGGFLCPYVAAHASNVRGIIGLGCGYVAEAYARCQPMRVEGLHGDQDERVDKKTAEIEFNKIHKTRHRGTFHLIPGLSHKVDGSIEPLVRQLALACFSDSGGKKA